jgi:hypothetical protein
LKGLWFGSMVTLRPGATARPRGEIAGVGEEGTLRQRPGKPTEIEPPTRERVVVTVVIYADGTRWQSE